MTAATLESPSVEAARSALSVTDGISEIVHPFVGGSHEFRYDEDGQGNPAVTLTLGGEDYHLDHGAFESALRQAPGVTDTLVEKWPIRFLMDSLNWWFDHKEGDFKMLAIGNDVVTIAKPKALLFDPKRILDSAVEAVTQHGGKELVVVDDFSHSLEQTRFTVHVPEGMNDRFIDARPGDRTLGGIAFSGSLLGREKLSVQLYTHRVQCSNGMVSRDAVRRFSVGNGNEEADGTLNRLYEWMDETTRDLFMGEPMSTELARIQNLTTHTLDGHAADALGDLFDRLRLPINMRSDVHDALADENDGTYYGLVQAITRAGRHSNTLEPRQRWDLMGHGGHATMIAQEICNECRRAMH